MHERRIPEWLRHAPAPSVRGFAILAGTEAIARGILISVFPVVMYRAIGDAAIVSKIYFVIGVISLLIGLLIPFLIRFVPRWWVYVMGGLMFVGGAGVTILETPTTAIAGLALTTFAVVTTFVCFNAYVLDHVAKIELGNFETSRLFYSAMGWTIGPALGTFLYDWWRPAPFLIATIAASSMLLIFLVMRLGNGKVITKSRRAPDNPFAYFGRFIAQPRLVTGWLFAVVRSCGWWVYVVYLPIYAIQNGFGSQLGGIALSIIGEVQIERGYPESPGNLVADDAVDSAGLARLAAGGERDGAHLWPQLGHAGALAYEPLSERAGPSALDFDELTCRELSVDEIEALPEVFAAAARRCKLAGFSGVEVHAGHGFLLSQFLSPLFNRRTDRYGGSIEARASIIIEIVERVRSTCGREARSGTSPRAVSRTSRAQCRVRSTSGLA